MISKFEKKIKVYFNRVTTKFAIEFQTFMLGFLVFKIDNLKVTYLRQQKILKLALCLQLEITTLPLLHIFIVPGDYIYSFQLDSSTIFRC